uniref:CUB domain-containing protein n=1 Tax=Magallana gigas TaxID=29159 RepID=K1RQJ2_MAGGI
MVNNISDVAGSPPSAPGGVRVVYREASFIVTWDVPRRTYGTVTNYVVPVTILPEANQTVYRSQIPLLVLDAGSEIGKMFYLTVSAENKDGLSKPSRPFYIRSPCGEALTVTPGSTITLTSPGYPDPVDRGVICQWGLNTTDTYLIQYRFVLIDFTGDSQTGGQSCDDAFLSLSDDQRPTVKICGNRSEQDIQRGPVDKFSFSSGIRSRIRKFKVMITAKGEERTSSPQTDLTQWTGITSAAPPGGTYTKGVSSGTDRLTIKTTANERLTTEANERPTTDNVQSADGLTPVIVGGSASAVVLLILIAVLIICRGCPRRSLPVAVSR